MSESEAVIAPAELNPSQLGTKQHWDEVYARELDNHSHDVDDEGTVWFDECGAEEAVMALLESYVEQNLLRKDGRVLDLGCGNGHMLFELREAVNEDGDEAPWSGQLVGVDYSSPSIRLAQQIAAQRESDSDIKFYEWDLLQQECGTWLGKGFDLVLDKGTFDAISLMAQNDQRQHSCEIYCERVWSLVKSAGILVITSCNWTKAELLSWFSRSPADRRLTLIGEAKYPSFTFGGRTGQSIVTLAFGRARD